MWGVWQKTADWQDKLHKRAAHKALNIPEEDVITSTNITNSGLGWKELLLMAGLVGGAGFGAYHLSNGQQAAPVQQVQPSQEDELPGKVQLRVKVTPREDGDHKIEVNSK